MTNEISVRLNEIKVRLNLYGFDCDPAVLTRELAIEPSLVWRVGDPIKYKRSRETENGWRLNSPTGSSAGVEEQILALLEILEPKAMTIKEFDSRMKAEFGCIIYAREYVPEMYFSHETLSRVVALGAEIDIDLYCLVNVA